MNWELGGEENGVIGVRIDNGTSPEAKYTDDIVVAAEGYLAAIWQSDSYVAVNRDQISTLIAALEGLRMRWAA